MDDETMNKPVISVLVPVFNVERYLAQALDSLTAQTFGDFEAILVNDGSTDGSADIMRGYAERDTRFRLVDKPNSGYGASMNRGIEEARGDYIAVLEPDDFLEPTALEMLVSAALETGVDVVKANYWFYWDSPRERNVPVHVVTPEMAGGPMRPREVPAIYYSIPSIWSGLYRRDFLMDEGIRFLETPGASFQDLGFAFKVWVAASTIHLLDDEILHYRQDNAASSVNNPQKVFCVCDEFDGIGEFLSKREDGDHYLRYAFRLRYDSYMWNLERLSPELRETFIMRMHDDLARDIDQGHYEPHLFGSWQRANLELMIENPERVLAMFPRKPTRFSKALYYMRVAGPRGLVDAARR